MNDVYILAQFVSAGYVFIMIATGTWKNSIATFVNVVMFFVFINMMYYGMVDIGLYMYMVVLLILIIKSILLRKKDRIFDMKSDIFKRGIDV